MLILFLIEVMLISIFISYNKLIQKNIDVSISLSQIFQIQNKKLDESNDLIENEKD